MLNTQSKLVWFKTMLKRRKWLSSLFVIFLGAFFVLWQMNHTLAGAITNMSISMVDNTYTIQMTPSTTIPVGGSIKLHFVPKDGAYTSMLESLTLGSGSSASITSVQRSGDNVLMANVGTEISAGTAVTIVAENMSNPSDPGRYYAVFWTQTGDGTILDGEMASSSSFRAYYTYGSPFVIGRVLDPDGNAVHNAHVDIHSAGPHGGDNSFWGSSMTDDLGYYSIGYLSQGTLTAGTEVRIGAHAPPEHSKWGMTNELTLTYAGSTLDTGNDLQFTEPTKTVTGTLTLTDGTPISGARINFWSMNGWANAETNSSGVYTGYVRGGRWEVMPESRPEDNWTYTRPPSSVTFNNDQTVESYTVDFTVTQANCRVIGQIRKPDGTAPNDFSMSVNLHSMMGHGGHSPIEDGGFIINVAPGTYDIDVFDNDQNFAAPDMAPISLSEDEILDMGTITLRARDGRITGQAVDENGNAVANVQLSAHMMHGKGWSETRTAADGTFTLKVFAGEWMVSVPNWHNDGLEYVLNGHPDKVDVESGETETITVNLIRATATISGNVVDTNGALVSNMYGWAWADRAGEEPFMGPGLGGNVDRGQYSFNVPAGTYQLGLGSMPGSDYASGEPTEVTLIDGQTLTHNFTVYANDMTVTGTIRDENGNTVSGVFMEVFATNHTGGWQNALIDPSAGTYTLRLSSAVDPWHLGYFVDPRTGYFSEHLQENSVSGDPGTTVTKNITIRRADSTISGRVVDSAGNAMEEVFVYADNRSADQEKKDDEDHEFMGPMFMNDNITDANGTFSINVPHGTYYVGASMPRNVRPDLINPDRVEVTVEADGTASVTLTFKIADATINGTVTLDGVVQSNAYLWAWSENGGYNETQADDNGNFTLNATQNDIWHIGVNNDVIGTNNYIKSTEYIVNVGTQTSITQDIDMETVEDGLANPLSTTFDVTNAKVSNLSDGSKVSVPANAMGTDGNVTLTASSTSEIPRMTNAKPIGTGLELNATDSDGSAVTSFNSNVTVTLPYDEDDLDENSITEDDLVAAYWDENNAIWQPLDNYSIDKSADTVTLSTSHFTTFALVSDTATSSESSTTAGTKANITSWKAHRYFNMAKKAVEKLKLVIKGKKFKQDTTVTVGGKEAYNVNVLPGGKKLTAKFNWKDLTKNNTSKLKKVKVANPNAETDKASKKLNLKSVPYEIKSDDFNDDTETGIMNVQKLLYNEGYLTRSRYITGVYDDMTRDAVKAFQKDHGMSQVGVVGPATKAKMIEVND